MAASALCLAAAFAQPAQAYQAFNGPLGLLTSEPDALQGYTLIAPQMAKKTYLVDMKGNVVQEWDSEYLCFFAMLDPKTGNLLRHSVSPTPLPAFGGQSGLIEEFDWTGKLVWQFNTVSEGATEFSHHTFSVMPNGNILALIWKQHSLDDAVAKGLDPNAPGRMLMPDGLNIAGKKVQGIFVDVVREIERGTGKTVWEWDVWDHLGTGPDQIDINKFVRLPGRPEWAGPDWTHFNGVSYNPETNEVCMSSRNLDEIYIIDYGKNDGVKMRWGNPANYGKGAAPSRYSDDGDQELFGPHGCVWTPEGTISIFDNGNNRPSGNYSRYVEITREGKIVREWKPSMMGVFDYNFYTSLQGGAQKLANGNLLLTGTQNGNIIEVTPDNRIVWEFINPMGTNDKIYTSTSNQGFAQQMRLHKAWRYTADDQELKGKDLSVKHPLMPEGTPDWVTLLKSGTDDPDSPKFIKEHQPADKK